MYMFANLMAGLICLCASVAIAEVEDQQSVAQANFDRLRELLSCSASKDPNYAHIAFDHAIPAPARIFTQHTSPRIIEAMIFTGSVPELFGPTWELVIEFTETDIYIIDTSVQIDPDTFETSPNPLPEFQQAPKLTERAKDAFVACGAVWLGNWEYEPKYSIGGVGSDSLLPP